jgi:hypothetical protein
MIWLPAAFSQLADADDLVDLGRMPIACIPEHGTKSRTFMSQNGAAFAGLCRAL